MRLCRCLPGGFLDGVRALLCGLVVLSGGFVPVLGDDAGAGAVDGDCGGEGVRPWVRTFGVNMRVLL